MRPITNAAFSLSLVALLLVACGGDPTPTLPPTNTPVPTNTPTLAPDVTPQPTNTPAPTPTPSGRDMDAYFGNNSIAIIVGVSPGGGYDTFARIAARFLPRYMPGDPRFIVRNVPGAGQQRGLQTTMRAEPNGFTTGLLASRFVKRELVGTDVPDFDLDTMINLGTPTWVNVTSAWYVRRDTATSWDEVLALGRTLTDGEVEVGSSAGSGPRFMEIKGAPIHLVYGYGGSSEVAAAFDRGEIDGTSRCSQDDAVLFPEWAEERFCVPVFRWGAEPEDDPLFTQWMQDLGTEVPPHMFDLVETTQGERDIFQLNEVVNNINRAFLLPPGTPDDIVAVWRNALRQAVEDPEFVEAARLLGQAAAYGSPEMIDQVIADGRQSLQDPELFKLFEELGGAIE